MVCEYIRELSILETLKLLVNFACFGRFLEVDGNLGSDSGQDLGSHACVTGLLEEEVLRLSEAEVTAHGQRFL